MSALRLLPLVLISTLIGALAKADDKDDVLAANNAFSMAWSTLRIEAMEPLWAHDDSVTMIRARRACTARIEPTAYLCLDQRCRRERILCQEASL
jgi:hypothetical protein